MSDLETATLETELEEYGIPSRSIQYLREQAATPEKIEYLDLIESRGDHVIMPDSVVESQGQPLLFVVNESILSQPPQDEDYRKLRHVLACRGQRAYLARLRAGELSVIPVKLSDQKLDWKLYRAGSDEALSFFPRLARGQYDGSGDTLRKDYVFEQMFKLLSQAAHELVETLKLESGCVLSLVGRALFFRFLRDRRIITEDDVKSIALKAQCLDDCFESATSAAATCQWLDKTFNGDFLPLTEAGSSRFFHSIGEQSQGKVFKHLSAIARAYEAAGQDKYQLRLWSVFDFAHIPVGLLSQVYEKFAWEWDPHAGSTSVHYTPRHIAATMVDEVFDKLPDAEKCRVLDPACGAGVFLVLAFRRLYRELWEATNVRPDTHAIRRILERQITGFDISESALKLAALGLYLTAIELDPEPIPPHKLKFNNLQGKILFNFRQPDELGVGPILGSLNPQLNDQHESKYDVVLSNPPWTSISEEDESLVKQLDEVSKCIIERRGSSELAKKYHNPDNAPDLPFLWKSTEWCKPNGRIAMALPARILLKQKKIPNIARKTLFSLLEVNGIINGSNLADTPVWPEMGQPFMLLFASNRKPHREHSLHFITPLYDVDLNQRGEMWVDSKSAVPVDVESTFEEPWLWKALTVGTALDVDVVRKIKAAEMPALLEYWEDDLGLMSRNGYQIASKQTQRDASHLIGLPDLMPSDAIRFLVHPEKLRLFSRETAVFPRPREAYRAPLVLVKQSPGSDRRQGWALLSLEDVAFSGSFYGYSGAGHERGELLTRYIQLFVHSTIWIYYALLTSPKIGAERRTIYKADIDACPIVPLDSLSPNQQKTIKRFSERLISEDTSVFVEIDKFFNSLYGLDAVDSEVIRDTFEVGMPFDESRHRACSSPTIEQYKTFHKKLKELLSPFFEVLDKEMHIEFLQRTANQRLIGSTAQSNSKNAFTTMFISANSGKVNLPDDSLWQKVLQLASEQGATQIFLEAEEGLLVAILNQYRYWTPTRARLCASEIVRQYMDIFET